MNIKSQLNDEYKKKETLDGLLATLDKKSGITSIPTDIFFYLFLFFLLFWGTGIKVTIIYLIFMLFFVTMRAFKKCPVSIFSIKQLEFIESSPVLSVALKSAITPSNKFYFHKFYDAVKKYSTETNSLIKSLEEQQKLEIEKMFKDNE